MIEPIAPIGRGFTPAQARRLMRPVKSDRIEQKRGLAYVPQQEVRAELARIFGPGNADHTMSEPQMIYETSQMGNSKGEKTDTEYWTACYMVGCTLRVRDYQGNEIYNCTEWHVEANALLPDRGEAHAMAVTSAQSYALRRAALSLGDAFGLHLYDGGNLAGIIGGSLMLEGDLDSPHADPNSPINIRAAQSREEATRLAAGFAEELRNPGPAVDENTGEVQEAPEEPEAPAKPTRTRKPAAAPETGAQAPSGGTPSMNDAFKKPTQQKAV